MVMDSCNTNCDILNLSTCTFKSRVQEEDNQVSYDSDGCFLESAYLTQGGKIEHFNQVGRLYMCSGVYITDNGGR